MQLKSRRCLLIGARGGIGRQVAQALAARGVDLVLAGRDPDALHALVPALRLHGVRVDVVSGDLLHAGGAQNIVARALEAHPELDLLVNAAGQTHFGDFEHTPPEVLERLLRVNLLGPMLLAQAAMPALRRSPQGLIVNVGSIFGSIGFPCFAAYSATKFALRGWSEALRREVADSRVGVLYFAPRYTRTALNEGAVERMAMAVGMRQDTPEVVAEALVSDIERDVRERFYGWPEKLFVRLNALWPRQIDGALSRQATKMRPFALERIA